ncbi:hypothetical protein BH23BAC1_BH23BAC1_23640 [soil metagenome]
MEWFGLNQQHLSLPEIFTNIYPKDQSLVNDTIQKSIARKGNLFFLKISLYQFSAMAEMKMFTGPLTIVR